MDRHLRWEHAGKGRRRADSPATGAHYVWDAATGSVRVEVTKGAWQAVGSAADLDAADGVAHGYEAVLLPQVVAQEQERLRAEALVQDAARHKALWLELFAPGGRLRGLYVAFCDLRARAVSCAEILKVMKYPPLEADRGYLVRIMEQFCTEGRR
jgi:hypothetical protein